MAGAVKGLVLLALVGAVGIMFVLLACALPQYQNWWPCFVVVFYMLAPLPYCIARRHTEDTGGSNTCMELAVFLTAGIVVSAFGLPIVLAHAPVAEPVIQWGACALVFTGNIVIFLTILGFFVSFDNESDSWSYF